MASILTLLCASFCVGYTAMAWYLGLHEEVFKTRKEYNSNMLASVLFFVTIVYLTLFI